MLDDATIQQIYVGFEVMDYHEVTVRRAFGHYQGRAVRPPKGRGDGTYRDRQVHVVEADTMAEVVLRLYAMACESRATHMGERRR